MKVTLTEWEVIRIVGSLSPHVGKIKIFVQSILIFLYFLSFFIQIFFPGYHWIVFFSFFATFCTYIMRAFKSYRYPEMFAYALHLLGFFPNLAQMLCVDHSCLTLVHLAFRHLFLNWLWPVIIHLRGKTQQKTEQINSNATTSSCANECGKQKPHNLVQSIIVTKSWS